MTIRQPRAAQCASDFRGRLGALGRSLPAPLRRLCDNRVRFDLHFDLGPFLQLNPLPLRVGKAIRNANFSIKMIGAFNRDLRFLWFTRPGVRLNYLFHFSWERSTRLRRLSRHNCGPPLGPNYTCDKGFALRSPEVER